MKVLVIGGTQFNGYFLVKELISQGHQVTLLNRGKTQAEIPEGVERLTADRTSLEQMKSALGDLEFDCVQDMCAYHPQDVSSIIELLEGRVGHYIFMSSTVIYASSEILPISEDFPVDKSENQNEYGMNKILCEEILFEACQGRGFPASVVPFSMVMGPRNIIPDREQRMFARILLNRPVLVPGDGSTLGQVGSVVDQSRALNLMMGNANTFGKRYNLTGHQSFSQLGYVQAFENVLGKKADIVHIPVPLMDSLWDGEIPLDEKFQATRPNIDIRTTQKARKRQESMAARFKLANLIQRSAPNIHRWNKSVLFSIERLCTETGFKPEYDLEQMLEEVHSWMQKESIQPDFDWALEDQILGMIGK